MNAVPDPVDQPLGRLMRLAQVADPQRLVETVSMTVSEIGGDHVALYLVDVDHTRLTAHPVSAAHSELPPVVSIEGSIAGRVLRSGRPLATQRADGWHVWIPVVERSEHLGVLAMTLPEWDDAAESLCVELGLATAHLVRTSDSYTDQLVRLRRRRHMSLAAEMQWALLPPLACSIGDTTVTGLLEPAYDVGGDCFDYALNGDHLDLAVLDSQGHEVRSAELSALTVAAYRNGRRSADSLALADLVRRVDAVVTEHIGPEEFVAGTFARLDVTSGELEWTCAGHPVPLHVRGSRVLPPLQCTPDLPLGLGWGDPPERAVQRTLLLPGDAFLMYTDGVTDAEDGEGVPFGLDRLRHLLAHESATERSPAELMRRIVHETLGHVGGRLRDDAGFLYLRWAGPVPSRRQ